MPDAGIPELRERIAAFARYYDKALGLLCADVVEHAPIDHYDSIHTQVGAVHQVDPMSAVAEQRIAQRLCEFGIVNRNLNCFHVRSPLDRGWCNPATRPLEVEQT